jgi:hypothetical protein
MKIICGIHEISKIKTVRFSFYLILRIFGHAHTHNLCRLVTCRISLPCVDQMFYHNSIEGCIDMSRDSLKINHQHFRVCMSFLKSSLYIAFTCFNASSYSQAGIYPPSVSNVGTYSVVLRICYGSVGYTSNS